MQFYMQDKRAKKRTPMVGTKKYPAMFLGNGKTIDNCIIIYRNFPFIFDVTQYRFYACDEQNGQYLSGITYIDFVSTPNPIDIDEFIKSLENKLK